MKVRIMSKGGEKVVNLNRRKAIRERCINCSGWSTSEVTHCTHEDCSLFPFRSGKGKQDYKKRQNAIRKYCLWCMAGQRSEVAKCVSRTCPLFAYRMWRTDKGVDLGSMPENDHIGALSKGESLLRIAEAG